MGTGEEVAVGSVWVCCRAGGDGGTGEQRASFRVDRSGGLYQNNTFVDYMKERRGDKEGACFEREYLHWLASCYQSALHDNPLKLGVNSSFPSVNCNTKKYF